VVTEEHFSPVFAHHPDEAGVPAGAAVVGALFLHQLRPFDVHVGSSLIGQLEPPLAHHPPVPLVYLHHSPFCALHVASSYAGHADEDEEHHPLKPSEFLHHLLPFVVQSVCSLL